MKEHTDRIKSGLHSHLKVKVNVLGVAYTDQSRKRKSMQVIENGIAFFWRRLIYFIEDCYQTLLGEVLLKSFKLKRCAKLLGSEHT